MTAPYKAIFWDNDGVLVDTEQFYFEANRRVYAEHDIELSLEQYKQFFLLESRGAWHLMDGKGYSEEKIESLKKQRNGIYAELVSTEDIIVESAAQTLEQLSPHYFMAIVTSAYREHFEVIHARSGFMKYFSFVLANGDYARSKPQPDPYLLAIERSGFAPADCIVVEDSERGLRAAKAAGLDCFVIKTEMTADADFSKADRVFDSLGEVREVLLNLVS